MLTPNSLSWISEWMQGVFFYLEKHHLICFFMCWSYSIKILFFLTKKVQNSRRCKFTALFLTWLMEWKLGLLSFFKLFFCCNRYNHRFFSKFAPFLKYGSKIFPSNELFLKFLLPMFANHFHTETMFVHVLEREFSFHSVVTNFAYKELGKWDFSERLKIGFFWWGCWVFLKRKNLGSYQNLYMGQLFLLQCVSYGVFARNSFFTFL